MKTLILITIATITLLVVAFKSPKVEFEKDSEKGIQFHKGSWNEALSKAQKENKLIFLDIYATWCGPCKKLKKSTFSSENVGEYFNNKYINVALDGEKGEGRELFLKYGLQGYPSLLFINSKGEVVHSTYGYHNEKDIIELSKKVEAKNK